MIEKLKIEFSEKVKVNPDLVKVRKLKQPDFTIKGKKHTQRNSLLSTYKARLSINKSYDEQDPEVIKNIKSLIHALEELPQEVTIYSMDYNYGEYFCGAFATDSKIIHIFDKQKKKS